MKKRIAFISEHASPLAAPGSIDSGGQNIYVAALAKHLVTLGYSIDIFTRAEHRDQPAIVSWLPDIRVIHVNAGPLRVLPKEELYQYMPRFSDQVTAFMLNEQITYELIHAHFWMSGVVACELKRSFKIPFVITFHALGHVRKIYQKENDKFPDCRIDIEKQIVAEANVIIAECPQDEEDLINYYAAPKEKIRIVPCGFSSEDFFPINKSEAREKIGLRADEKVILQLGRMVPRKGIDNVIRALGFINETDSVKLLIVGGDTPLPDPSASKELARLMNIAAEAGVSANVEFTGPKNRQELKYYYSAADIFITTPWYEPFGITPLEAMACGTPVIGSDVGGVKYSVADGQTGCLVPPDKPEILAATISQLFSDRVLLKQMGREAILRVNTLFTWRKVALEMAGIYASLAKLPVHSVAPRKQIKAA